MEVNKMVADIINKSVTVKEGNEILVMNQDPKLNASKIYRALWIEDWTGKETCCLFKEKDLSAEREVIIEGLNLKSGHVVKVGANRTFVLFKFTRWEGDVVTVKIPFRIYEQALDRAKKNPEDIPKKNMLIDLLD
jgi:hypothetical protein